VIELIKVSSCLFCIYRTREHLHISGESAVICGVTTLDGELYVLRSARRLVEVYDTGNYTLQRQMKSLAKKEEPTSQPAHHSGCVYISDRVLKCIHRIEKQGRVTQWAVNDTPNGLSVTSDHNLLVACGEARKLKDSLQS